MSNLTAQTNSDIYTGADSRTSKPIYSGMTVKVDPKINQNTGGLWGWLDDLGGVAGDTVIRGAQSAGDNWITDIDNKNPNMLYPDITPAPADNKLPTRIMGMETKTVAIGGAVILGVIALFAVMR